MAPIGARMADELNHWIMVQISFALIALTALSTLPSAVLAEPHHNSKAKPHLDSSTETPLNSIQHDRRQAGGCNFPNPPAASNVRSNAPIVVRAGRPFNGGGRRYGRGLTCNNRYEGGRADAVFVLEPGAVIENTVIGRDNQEGIHCLGPCTIRNVWFEKVCEDAITLLQGSGISAIIGGGARSAVDKVIQHNGGGMVNIQGFCAQDFGALYRSCGNCRTQATRQVRISQVTAINGRRLVGVNANYGDVATIDRTTRMSRVQSVCDTFRGNNNGGQPQLLTNRPSASCRF
ncbi:Pectate lyase [Ceratobasidium theobromae]|uniref:Pectate lyase n=1 Tax=Ceratobasidium theobromae TaxID=1582974 RepID=A0A5N5QMQ7_9AGAM|nr:Pectate lyase [Ceratobasidium theobromae]